MGIYIDMEMPKICGQCQIKLGIDCELWRHIRSVSLNRHKDCPLVPAANVRPVVRGKWIWDGYVYDVPWQCSNCGVSHDADSNFCPNCGADMRDEQDA